MDLYWIEKSITDAIEKCSNDVIHQRLSGLTREEKLERLDGKVNPFELEDYKADLNLLDYHKKLQEEGYSTVDETVEFLEKEIFNYEKRIYRGYDLDKNKDKVPSYNIEDYSKDNDTYDSSKEIEDLGGLEQAQINSQSNINLTGDEAVSLCSYFGNNSLQINSMLDHDYGSISEYSDMSTYDFMPQEVKDSLPNKYGDTVKNIDSAINKNEGLLQPTVLYTGVQHSHIVDVHTRIGDKITMPSYISTSFQEDIGVRYGQELKGYGVASKLYVKFLAPKGTKGFTANDNTHTVTVDGNEYENVRLSGHLAEHEYLLGRGQSGTVVDIDYDLGEVTILLDEA